MANVETLQIQAFLTEVGRRYTQPSTLLLIGGSALCLLGSPRPTLDIDYVGHDLHKNELQQVIDQVAQEMQLEVEAVPIDEFVPLPLDAQQRRLPVGLFGTINVYILDPYTIALSKLDRGFDTDLEDIVFLLNQRLITFNQLAAITQTALIHAPTFNLNSSTMLEHLQAVRDQL